MRKTPPNIRTFTDEESRETRAQVRTQQPARVISYDRGTQRAKIELSAQTVLVYEDGRQETLDPVILESVPVVWPSGSGYLHIDLQPGHTGLAVVCDRSIASWRTDGKAHPPPLPSLHNLADAVFLPGLWSDVNPLTPAPAAGTTLEDSAISLGAAATDFVTLANKLHTYLQAMVTASAASFLDGGAALTTFLGANPPVGPTGFAATKVKAE